jgi:uncharacterized repeat protein (TIGR01451 family)
MRHVLAPFGRRAALALLSVVSLAIGCISLERDPIVRTHGKPGGLRYYRNFDRHACRIELLPAEDANPVRTQHVLIATVFGDDGCPKRGERVEWILARGGVGEIVEVDESGLLPSRGYKVDNYYAVSYTNHFEHRLSRGTADATDDICLKPGQTWCVITSPIEGDTHVTAYAPGIYSWDCHKAFAVKHWIDARWDLPVPAVNPVGTNHTFVTRLFRVSNGQPLPNHFVRYSIVDGPPGTFVTPSEVKTDLKGVAAATMAQNEPAAGANQIDIEIVRPDGIVIGRGRTQKTWVASDITIQKQGPKTANLGSDVEYSITLSNPGQVAAEGVTVTDVIPPGMTFVGAEPEPKQQEGKLVWALGNLAGGGSSAITLVLKADRVGRVTNRAEVRTQDGTTRDSAVDTDIVAASVEVSKTGPTQAAVGDTVTYTINIRNPSQVPATNLVVTDTFDKGFMHESGSGPIENKIGTLAAGESQSVTVELTGTVAGRLTNRVAVRADGGITASAEASTTFVERMLQLDKSGPNLRYRGRPTEFTIRLANPTDVPLTNVVVVDAIPAEMSFRSASDGGRQSGNQVTWQLGTLAPQTERAVKVTLMADTPAESVRNTAVATADGDIRVEAEHTMAIRGVPGLSLQAFDLEDPFEVGTEGTYTIEVHNQGTAAADGVAIVATLPDQMQPVDAKGPTKYRVTGQQITFEPYDGLAPNEKLNYQVRVKCNQPGLVLFKVELRAKEPALSGPVVEEESTTIYQP